MSEIYKYILDLLRLELKGDSTELKKDIDYMQLYLITQSNSIEAMVYSALNKLNAEIPKEVNVLFDDSYDMSVTVEAIHDYELECMEEAFDNNGVDFVPLKGSVLKYLYPESNLRQRGDIDILLRETDMRKADDIMKKLEYIGDELNDYEHHLGYRKEPFVIVELHKKLMSEKSRSYDYFKNIWDLMNPVSENGHRYEMTKEDFYTYILAHFAKHIKSYGAGIRFVVDIFVIEQKWGEKLDREKLYKSLKKANVFQFYEWVYKLQNWWFNGIETNDENVKNLSELILKSGTFGNNEIHKINKDAMTISAPNEKKYMIKRILNGIFPSYIYMRNEYPVLAKKKWLMPIFWIIRGIDLISHPQKLKKKVKYATNINTEEAEKYKEIMKAMM